MSLSKHSPWFGCPHGFILEFWKTLQKRATLCFFILARVHGTKIVPKKQVHQDSRGLFWCDPFPWWWEKRNIPKDIPGCTRVSLECFRMSLGLTRVLLGCTRLSLGWPYVVVCLVMSVCVGIGSWQNTSILGNLPGSFVTPLTWFFSFLHDNFRVFLS